MKKVESFQNRFNYVLNLRGLRQVDIVNATGLSKEIIHKYCIGTAYNNFIGCHTTTQCFRALFYKGCIISFLLHSAVVIFKQAVNKAAKRKREDMEVSPL